MAVRSTQDQNRAVHSTPEGRGCHPNPYQGWVQRGVEEPPPPIFDDQQKSVNNLKSEQKIRKLCPTDDLSASRIQIFFLVRRDQL